ncbi:MAG: hypothetical protein JF616_08120 [Fibrobacteres bacterium]|nr:hypothetical protein [Fibrobacterota bacterium]
MQCPPVFIPLRRRAFAGVGLCLLAAPLALSRPVQAQSALTACLTASPAAVDFGPVPAGGTAGRTVSLRNTCRFPVTITYLAASPRAFSVADAASLRISALGARNVQVRFAPGDTAKVSGELRVGTSNPSRTLRIALRGTGVAAAVRSGNLEVSPSRIDETLPAGHLAGRIVSLTNHGQSPMEIFAATWVEAPGTGGDSAAKGLSIYYFTTANGDDGTNSFTDYLGALPKVSKLTIRSGEQRTPSLQELLDYDMVVVSSGGNWADPDSAGNVLADYVDRGRPVILMHMALNNLSGYHLSLGGRIVGPDYAPVPQSPSDPYTDISTRYFIDNPLTQSVDWFESHSIQAVKTVQGKGEALGYLEDGNIAAAYNCAKPVYYINLFPYEPDFSGYNGLFQLILNIIDQTQGTHNWLRNPVSNHSLVLTLAPGETRGMILPVGHTYPLAPGKNYGTVEIFTNDGSTPIYIPATLQVTSP